MYFYVDTGTLVIHLYFLYYFIKFLHSSQRDEDHEEVKLAVLVLLKNFGFYGVYTFSGDYVSNFWARCNFPIYTVLLDKQISVLDIFEIVPKFRSSSAILVQPVLLDIMKYVTVKAYLPKSIRTKVS